MSTNERDTLFFPVVGRHWMSEAVKALDIPEGDPLWLFHDPDSLYSDAINVMWGSHHVGYVPNRGWSCSSCWTGVPARAKCCPRCGLCTLVPGGLATRIFGRKLLDSPQYCVAKYPKTRTGVELYCEVVLVPVTDPSIS